MTSMFDGVFYINLDVESERRASIENELLKVGLLFQAERVSGIVKKPYLVGIAQTHIAILDIILKRKLQRSIVFEDDFVWLVSSSEVESAFQCIHQSSFHGVVIDYGGIKFKRKTTGFGLQQIQKSTRTGCYILDLSIVEKLRNCWMDGLKKLSPIDHSWKPLQCSTKWYAWTPRLGRQNNEMFGFRKDLVW